jgi:membrane peptidoglycan carboxypeptidase
VPLAEVPRYLVDALTTAEDATFFQHKGFSTVGIRRSVKVNLERGGFYQGASTLSQQLVKNLFLSREKTLSRKLQEVFLTWQLEQSLPKEKILELYLNVIEWGPGVYGLRAASRHYFGKEPAELTPREGAFLVALIPAPIRYQASIRKGELTPRFASLVNTLLAKLRSVDELTDEGYDEAVAERLSFASEDASGSPPAAPRTAAPAPTAPAPAEPAPGS